MIVGLIIADLDRRDALQLAEAIAKKHWVELDDVLGRSRRGNAIRARHELWAKLHEEAIPSYRALGRVFGRDPSTIAYAVRRHASRSHEAAAPAAPIAPPDHESAEPCRASS